MNGEYNMLRTEAQESINKQDTLTNIVFTVLGASSLYTNWNKDIPFIILIELISAVLLARILHYRHVSLYIATYLTRMEQVHDIGIHWETNLGLFNDSIHGKQFGWKRSRKVLRLLVQAARLFKHFGNLVLALYLFSPIFPNLPNLFSITNGYLTVNLEILLALFALVLNFVFSLGICFCYKLRPDYASVWESILPIQEHPPHDQ